MKNKEYYIGACAWCGTVSKMRKGTDICEECWEEETNTITDAIADDMEVN